MILFRPFLLALGLCSCGDSTPKPDSAQPVPVPLTRPLFELPAGPEQDLYALPYPNNLRRQEEGGIDLARMRSDDSELIRRYMEVVSRATPGGFALNAGAFFRFDGPIAPACLPQTPQDSLDPKASVIWVNLQQDSPQFGKPLPLRFKFSAEESQYIGANNLAILPVAGFSLEPRSRYAVILRDTLCDAEEQPLGIAANFDLLLGEEAPEDPALMRAHQLYAPLRDFLLKQGITGVIAATLFTTGDPTALAPKIREVVHALPVPSAGGLGLIRETALYWEVQGTYDAPYFQQGTPPFFPTAGGEILLDEQGLPVVARMENLRFAMTVPKAAAPPAGWPVVIYAHGTGGDYRSFIRGGVSNLLAQVKDSTGNETGRFVVISIDQNLHGARVSDGFTTELTFFNYQNPEASINNVIQAGVDNFALIRRLKGLRFDGLPWGPDSGHAGSQDFSPAFQINPEQIFFMGHSQGAITGPVFLAFEPDVKAVVLSGAGGNVVQSLLDKTEPIEIRAVLKLVLRGEIDAFHPVLNLMQELLEPAETLNYGPMLTYRPAPGIAPKHIFLAQGFEDHYTPRSTTDALARGMRLPQLGPIQHPIDFLELFNLPVAPLPASGNLSFSGPTITAGVLQYKSPKLLRTCTETKPCESGSYCESGTCRADGHFVIFDVPNAMRQFSNFLASMVTDGIPTIVP